MLIEPDSARAVGRPRALDENQEILLVRAYWNRKLKIEKGSLADLADSVGLSHRAMLDIVDLYPDLVPTPNFETEKPAAETTGLSTTPEGDAISPESIPRSA